MMRIVKTPAPGFLQNNYKRWGRRYKAKRENPDRSNLFVWATYQGQRVNLRLLPFLRTETNCHCSFCDGFPLDATGETIEHFRPKSIFPRLSYVWTNLFYCCKYCNESKQENPERNLLKPDNINYSFEKYFLFDYDSGKIEVNPALITPDRIKAENTILIYGLNEYNRPYRRKSFLKLFQNTNNPDIEDFPYRFIFQ
jgi:uncharacterized protein (TIGR02646 family)